MPKKKRTMSPEKRAEASARMKAKWAEKKAAGAPPVVLDNPTVSEEQPGIPPTELENPVISAPVEPTPEPDKPSEEANVDELRSRVSEMQDLLIKFMAQGATPQGNQATVHGIVGTTTKFSVEPKDYPDPTIRIADEPKLQRFAFKHNYELTWAVSSVAYTTKDNLNFREPKFSVELRRIMLDDEGEPTNKRFTIRKATFFEDPDAALAIAREQGYELPETTHKDFLDEMRYLRVRDWVFEAFYPPQITETKRDKKEMVINNRLVEVFEISSPDSQAMPFDQLDKKF